MMSAALVFCVAFVAALVNAVDKDVRPSAEPSECLCKFPKHHTPDEELLDDIRPLCGKRYSVEDDRRNGYKYTVGICTTALPRKEAEGDLKSAGAIQVHKEQGDLKPDDHDTHVIGSFERAEIMSGYNWLMLEYEGGETFHTHCTNEEKRTMVMIMCKPGETTGRLRWVEENSNKTGDCYYLFELDHEAACMPQPTGLSTGSVICIIMASFVVIYLVGGVVYMRLIRKAKGLNQIPNYEFWRDFGALQADGCDLICRCGAKPYDSTMNYHGIGDHQIECPTENDELDERLLPM